VNIEIPVHIHWSIHRVAVSGKYRDPLHTIETEWSFQDLLDANDVLDAIEDAEESLIHPNG
jgi:hypothetical protein